MLAPPSRRHTVSVLVFDGMAPFELGTVVEVFGLPRPELGVPWYDLRVCSLERGPMRAVGGFTMAAEHGLDAFASADTVLVVAVPDVRRDPAPEVVAALREAHARGARVVSICSGAFALAAAGLLDGREATTHWRYADLLRRRYPKVRVTPDVLYVDGDDVLTGAGSAAGLDMCLHLVRRDHGARVANAVARRLVVPPHRDGGPA
jgi:AraC family transcriptional regulator, transcriptional activator FtrA